LTAGPEKHSYFVICVHQHWHHSPVVKSLFGLMRSLFFVEHCMTDHDSKLSLSLTISNASKSDEISWT
jgi:hypothetical protein